MSPLSATHALHATHAPLVVVASPEMVAPAEGYSPSAQKPAAVLADWRACGLPLDVRPVVPASVDELATAHDRGFVQDVLAGRRANGFGTRSPRVAASLPFTTGAMLTAARLVLSSGGPRAACAPVSGFHHAGYARADGFCTFNGLMVTALTLLAERRARRVTILDCDHHYGDGTDDILSRGIDPRVGSVHHFTAGQSFFAPAHVPAFFAALDSEIARLTGQDIVLYQAGADPHVNDPLGGWLTDDQLRERDARVFEGAARAGVPLVWNLAGGYQRDANGGIAPVLAVHRATAREHGRVFGGW